MTNAVMLLSNPFRPDPRVLKEARSLAEHGHQITILAWDRKNEFHSAEWVVPGFQVIRIQNSRSQYGIGARQITPLLRFWRSAWAALNEIRPDLVHCHDFDTLPVGWLWSKRSQQAVIYDAHEYYADMVKPRLNSITGRLIYMAIRNSERFFCRHVDAVITVDETLAGIYRRVNKKVLVIGHYPSIDFVNQYTAVFTSPELNLIYQGRLSRDRGLLVYLDLLRCLHAEGIPTRLILAGVFTPASEEQVFSQASGDLSDSIQLSGWVSYNQMPELIAQADVGLSLLQPEPRYIAALPVKLFEYMAAGLPVIASDFPLIHQIIQAENNGALIDPADAKSAAKILAYWWRNPELPRQLGKNGRQAVIREYNWENLVDKLNALYRSLT